jgi:hypothetical protein
MSEVEWLHILEGAEAQGIQLQPALLDHAVSFCAARTPHNLADRCFQATCRHIADPRFVNFSMQHQLKQLIQQRRNCLEFIFFQSVERAAAGSQWSDLRTATATLHGLHRLVGSMDVTRDYSICSMSRLAPQPASIQAIINLLKLGCGSMTFTRANPSIIRPVAQHLPTSVLVAALQQAQKLSGELMMKDMGDLLLCCQTHLENGLCSPAQLLSLVASAIPLPKESQPDSTWWAAWASQIGQMAPAFTSADTLQLFSALVAITPSLPGDFLRLPSNGLRQHSNCNSSDIATAIPVTSTNSSSTPQGSSRTPTASTPSRDAGPQGFASALCYLLQTHLPHMDSQAQAHTQESAAALAIRARDPAFRQRMALILEGGPEAREGPSKPTAGPSPCEATAVAQADAATPMLGLPHGKQELQGQSNSPSAPPAPAAAALDANRAVVSLKQRYITKLTSEPVAQAHSLKDSGGLGTQPGEPTGLSDAEEGEEGPVRSQVEQVLEALQRFCDDQVYDDQAYADQQHNCETALDLLVQCAVHGIVPKSQEFVQLWAALEPRVKSLSPELLAEAMLASAALNTVSSEGWVFKPSWLNARREGAAKQWIPPMQRQWLCSSMLGACHSHSSLLVADTLT